MKDIFSLYPTKDIVLSALALSRLQRASSFFAENMEKELKVPKKNGAISEFFFSFLGFTNNNVRGSVDTNKGWEYEKELLSDLAHYAVFANAIYGWKLGFALSGILHLGDMKALIKKTGVRKEDIVATRWHSRTYLPVSEKRSLPYSDIVQMGYFSPENILKILFTRCTKAYFIVRDVKRKHIVLCINQQSFKEEEGGIDLTKIRSKYRVRAHQGMLEGARGVQKL